MNDKLAKPGDGITCPVAVILRDGNILTGHRHYVSNNSDNVTSVWALPGGRSDLGETIEETLRRETIEEVNISDLEILDFIGEVPGAKEGDTVLLFHCTTNQNAECMEPQKFSEWRWVPLTDYITGEEYKGFNESALKMIGVYFSDKN